MFMELKDIINVVEEKAEAIAKEEIGAYNKKYPELTFDNENKNAVIQRAISQLTLQLSKFKFNSEQDMAEQFNNWFEANEAEDLRKACRHCLDDEANRIRNSKDKSLSSLDVYLKKHLGDVHNVD